MIKVLTLFCGLSCVLLGSCGTSGGVAWNARVDYGGEGRAETQETSGTGGKFVSNGAGSAEILDAKKFHVVK